MKKLILTSALVFGITGGANAAVNAPQLWPLLAENDFGFAEDLLGIPAADAYAAVSQYVDEINQGLADYTGEINSEFATTNANITRVSAQLAEMNDDLQDQINSGIASANALSGLDNHLDAGKKFSVGVGGGYYQSTGGFAFGGAVRTSDASALNAGVAVSTAGDFSAKAGWNMQF